jgi:Histidine kinase/Y_Y_Y domain
MDKIIVSNHEVPNSSRSFLLRHKDNNIRFEFAGISFRSGGEMMYEYQLVGLDTLWNTTKENFLNYPTLPSGDYTLALRAVNKFGIKSNIISIPFSVEKLLSEKTWFRLLMLVAILAAGSFVLFLLVRRGKMKAEERNQIREHIAELEQMALKSQMNPHFIFNCLNSIQQFVIDKDVAGCNRFITGFSRLIRQTLDISAKKEISISEEIVYLSTYLELEKTRFEDKFKYEFRVTDSVEENDYHIPPMMLQPFVENSIRHGIRYRKDD